MENSSVVAVNSSEAVVVLPNPTSSEEQSSAEVVSIIFAGEKITAPGVYTGVPDLYVPVLDDLYLLRALSRRRVALQRDGQMTREITNEYDEIRRDIRTRGHLPYPGSGSDGYALVDLDGDNCLELLILDTPHNHTHSIRSVFAILNGQLVCIDNGSSELSMGTLLAADGTFYQCVGWRGIGYTDLNAFRLESEMSTFTTIVEARASLSFSDGDIPVPYWVKIENGEEIYITEDEFSVLYEQHKYPKELMTLNFVPLLPDIEHSPIPQSNEEYRQSVEFPQSYKDAPSEYNPILDDLFLLSARIQRGDSINSIYDDWSEKINFSEFPHGELGYAVVDINNDGTLELLLGTKEGFIHSAPYSIFTLKDGKPIPIASFWSRSHGAVSANGTIYTVASGGASYTHLSSYRLDENADTLTLLTSMSSDYSFSEEKPYFVRVENDRNHFISEEEFYNYHSMYYNPPEAMELIFIPISN